MNAAMPDVGEMLRAAGIAHPADAPLDVRVECTRIAREIGERRLGAVGLLPASDDVAVPGPLLVLAAALAEQRGPVAAVDALGTWPCARRFVEAVPGEGPVAAGVAGRLALVAPRGPGADAGSLRDLLAWARQHYPHVLVDLTGLDHLGEQYRALELLDAALLVARSGGTRLRRLSEMVAASPPDRTLGVLLTGTRPPLLVASQP